jgi:hypothetical protein
VLTSGAVAELVAAFQAIPAIRGKRHATDRKSRHLDPTGAARPGGRGRGHRSSPHGGGGE